MKKKHNVFVQGPVLPSFIAESVSKHQSKTGIGAHAIFLGQVRKDKIGESVVASIEYSAYEEMANDVFGVLREATFGKFNLECLHIYHSLGNVPAGEISLFVFVSSVHRKDAFEACRWLVDEIKRKVPVWGKEILEDGSHHWKRNTVSS